MVEDLEQHIKALATQAEQCNECGNYAQALTHAQEAYDLSRNLLAPKHSLVATAMNELAVAHQAMGNFAAAQPLLEQALEIRRRALEADHPAVATSLNNLAMLYALWATTSPPSRCMSKPWACGAGCWGTTTPRWLQSSATWPCCLWQQTGPMRGWRIWKQP